jgi:hypothetical protein
MFLITCYTEADTCRLRLDAALKYGDTTGARRGAKNIIIYGSIMHPLNNLDPSKCGNCITARDRATWAVNTLKLLEQFPTIKLPDDEGHIEEMDTREGQIFPTHTATTAAKNVTGVTTSNKGKAPAASGTPQPRHIDRDISPERRAYIAHVDPNRIKNRQNNKFQPLAEEHSQDSARNIDRDRDESVSDANISRGARMRDLISLTPEILAILDRHEPDKTKQAKLLT